MRHTLYRQMVYWINNNRTWVEVADAYMYKGQIATRNGKMSCIVCRTLVLRAIRPHGDFYVGQTWEISDIALDRAVAAYRKSDYSFKCRIKKGGSYLTAKDAETIIRLATHDVIHLELIEQPTHKYY